SAARNGLPKAMRRVLLDAQDQGTHSVLKLIRCSLKTNSPEGHLIQCIGVARLTPWRSERMDEGSRPSAATKLRITAAASTWGRATNRRTFPGQSSCLLRLSLQPVSRASAGPRSD